MASIKDVAKLAGVSAMTVSRVINAKDTVSRKNKSRVLRAIDALGYLPSRTARTLRSRRSHIIGLLLPNIENPVFVALAKHVEEEANRSGYNIMIANTWESASREANCLELMLSLLIDGIIISPVSSENDELINRCKTPVVVLDRSLKNNNRAPIVAVDNLMIGRLAARHLLALGHRHFACLTGPSHIDVFSDRLEGFRDELGRSGHGLDLISSIAQIASVEQASAAAKALLQECAPRPLAVFCVSDLAAIGVIKEAKRMGIAVPGDLSVVGVDGIQAGDWITPSLTTIRQPFAAVASAGVELLVRMIGDAEYAPESINLRPEIVARDSSGEVSFK